jgi:predicted amino acid dehydrogenase
MPSNTNSSTQTRVPIIDDYRFAFLVHPRGFTDIYTTFPFTHFLPKWIIRKCFLLIGPLVIGKVFGLKTKEGKMIKGEIIVVPMTARDMMADKKRAAREVERSLRFAAKRGAKMVGLGSLTSPVVGGGVDVIGKFDTKITNGNALTAFMAYEGVRIACEKKGIDMTKAQFAIVGATGSTGSAVLKLLIRDGLVKNEILVGRTPEHLENAAKELRASFPNINVRETTDIHEIINADVVVVATSAEGAIIKAADLKKNAIVYDVTQPQNVPQSIIGERPDVVVVDGAISKLPEGVGYTVNMGLARGESFSCLAETMILAQEKYNEDFSVGRVTLQNIDIISRLAEKYGFKRAPLRSWGKIII